MVEAGKIEAVILSASKRSRRIPRTCGSLVTGFLDCARNDGRFNAL